MAKKKLAVIPADDLKKDIEVFYESLNSESDLVAVLLAVNYVDQLLLALVHQKLRKCGTTDDLLRHDGPVGSFANRAKLAYSIHAIESDTLHTCLTMASIRNVFAHSHTGIKFDHPEVKRQCDLIQFAPAWKESIDRMGRALRSSRGRYTIAAAIVAQAILRQLDTVLQRELMFAAMARSSHE